jgi:hypothetical protein
MLAMRRESDNLNNSSSNTPHSNLYTASNLSGDNNLTHLNYPHPVHSYSTSAGYSGYQSSKKTIREIERKLNLKKPKLVTNFGWKSTR